MAFDSSDSDENLIKNYDPHVELPSVLPVNKTPIKEQNLSLEKNTSKSLEVFKDESESSGEFNFDLYKPTRKKSDSTRKRTRRNREKDTLNFKPAPVQKERNVVHEDSDEDFEKLHDQEVSPEDLPDVVLDDDIGEEEEDDRPLVNEDWKSKNVMSRPVQRRGEEGDIEAPRVKKPNPRIGRVMKRKPAPPGMNVSTSSPNFKITPPDGSRRPRPVPKKKHKQSDSEQLNDNDKESNYADSDSYSNPVPPRPKKKSRKGSQAEQDQVMDDIQQEQPSLNEKIQKAISQVQESVEQSPQQSPQITPIVLTFVDYISSIEFQGALTKRTFVKLFENTKPLYSVKFKNGLTDGNFNVSIGANAHISKGSHYATIIVANEKTDFSLRKGSFEGQELVTIRTTVNKKDGRSGHAIFIHGIPGSGPIDLVGYWSDDSTLTFKEKYSNQVFGVFALLSATTINAHCSQFIDSVRCLAICFALFMTNNR